MTDPEDAALIELTLDPDMIWATRVDPEHVQVYIDEQDTMVFSNEAAKMLLKALIEVLEEK